MDKPRYDEFAAANDASSTATNDAVAGETILPQSGEGNDGPTGGAPREASPVYAETDDSGEALDEGDL